jgi:hypothetical protein
VAVRNAENIGVGGNALSLRFCARCRADVEDAGGYCLLGHPFPQDTSDPISDLRAEVDKAFEKIKIEIPVSGMASTFQTSSAPSQAAPSFEPYEELRSSDEHLVEEMAQSRRDYWSQLRDEVDSSVSRDDPILSFSPSPRMEWGPEKGRRRKRS